MIDFEILEAESVVIVKPSGPLSEEDFEALTESVDLYLEAHDGLSGLMVQVEKFPGWENLSGLVHHFQFIRDHHLQIRKVALVTDSHIATAALSFANHFVSAEVQYFPFAQVEEALLWIKKE